MRSLRCSPSYLRKRLGSIGFEARQFGIDIVAGLQGALSSVPSGMATAVLAGVHPIQGLYACVAGPIAGGLTARTKLMIISTTGAVALAAGSALRYVHPAQRPAAIGVLTLVVAAVLVVAGLLKLGRYTRFVTHSVMIGFLTGISVNIVCGQVAGLTGATAHGHTAIEQALSVLAHPGRMNVASTLTGLAALAILAALVRTRLAQAGMVLAIVVPTVVVAATGAPGVSRVSDSGHIPPGIPAPSVPHVGLLSYGMITGALAVAAIVAVQGAGVAELVRSGAPEPSEGNLDLIAQGLGNLASSVLHGIPVGASLGQSVNTLRSGAKTRFAAVAVGLWMVVFLVAFSGILGDVAVPTLSAVLIFLGARSLQPAEFATIWRTGPSSQVAILTTLIATLLLPVAAAVGVGVALTLMQQLVRDQLDLSVVELIPLGDGRLAETTPPGKLESRHVTILDVYGSLLYAGSRTLLAKLPDPTDTQSPVVVLRLRGRTSFGATFVKIISDYAGRLAAAGGRIYLSGLSDEVIQRLRGTGRLGGPVQAEPATPILGESTYVAYLKAQRWLASNQPGD